MLAFTRRNPYEPTARPEIQVRSCASQRNDVWIALPRSSGPSGFEVGGKNGNIRILAKSFCFRLFLEWEAACRPESPRVTRGTAKFWMLLDVRHGVAAAIVATCTNSRLSPIVEVRSFWHGTLFRGRSMWISCWCCCRFHRCLSDRDQPAAAPLLAGASRAILNEQRLTRSGLLHCRTAAHRDTVPGSCGGHPAADSWCHHVGTGAVSLGVRRLVYRILLYRRFERGLGTRNVLIVGTGPEAHALRHHLESIRHLGYTFKGFIDIPGTGSRNCRSTGRRRRHSTTVCFTRARKQFVDEIFFTAPCEQGMVQEVLEKARAARRRSARRSGHV